LDPKNISGLLDTTGWKAAAYGQISHRFRQIDFRIGLRLNYFSLIAQQLEWDPRISLTYKLNRNWNITASAGRYHQSPATVWLVAVPANRDLRQMRTDQYIAGLEYYWKSDTRITLEVYQKRYRHYPASTARPFLLMVNTGAGFGGSDEGFASFGIDPLVSAGYGRSQGAELFIQKRLSEVPLYGTVTVSYSTARFTGIDNIERPGSFDQNWIINLGGGYVLNAVWEFSAKFRYATGRPYTPVDQNGQLDYTRYNAERISRNHSLDLRVDRRWYLRQKTRILYLDVQNVYNRKPAEVPRYDPETGEIEEQNAIGILPSIGFSLEF